MNFLESLGLGLGNPLGSLGFDCSPLSAGGASVQRVMSERELAKMQYQALTTTTLICIHSNCPICKKQAEKQAKLAKKEYEEKTEIAKKKKEDYDRREREWIKRVKSWIKRVKS